ncbi:MAG: type II toxin-antitoxin system Phd/YefM family antitoxin [Rhodocyclaceae bacterium]
MSMLIEVGAYEAKTHLAEFLRKVKNGETYRITQRGEPVADLVPVATRAKQSATSAATRMLEFMSQQAPIAGADVRALIEEGRD